MLSEDLNAAVEAARREAAEATPEHNLRAAALLREAKPLLNTERQREIAEELAVEFEARNANRELHSARS
jgi:hypothetical protein